MPTYIVTYDLSEVWPEPEVIRWCSKNNFNVYRQADDHAHGGLILTELKRCLKEDRGYLIMAHNGEKWTGWGLAYKDEGIKMFQCYVPIRQRRKGIGSRILKKACNILGRVEVYDIDTSNKFFKSNGLTKGDAITGRKLKV
jgi:hypothetical protein